MSRTSSFTRKVIYATCIALLLYPLYYLGQPATRDGQGGGQLAQMRARSGIAQSQLGDIEPASETMRLATLGLRGAAVALLWEKANDFKMRKDWENLSNTVQQIIKLQPNFVSVWEFQGHNLAYNVSVEFDDYHHRYEWVKRGSEFLVQGAQYNRDDPALIWYIGWVIGQKFGRSDEHRQFRRMFPLDEDFHRSLKDRGEVPVDSPDAQGPDGRPDNWLVARLWFEKGIAAMRAGKPLRRKSPLVYYSTAYHQRINHAVVIEEEGTLDEKAQFAWVRALEDWNRFGDTLVPSSWGHNIRLNDLAKFEAERDELAEQLDQLATGLRDTIGAEKRAKLTDEQRKALELPAEKRIEAQQMAAHMAGELIKVRHLEVAERAPEAVRPRAKALAQRLTELENVHIAHVKMYRTQSNFDYWLMRCEVEQRPDAIKARKHLYDASRYLDQVNPDAARKEYELAWDAWADLFEKYPLLFEEQSALADLSDPMRNYLRVLTQLDLKLPENFRLNQVLERNPALQASPAVGGPKPGTPAKPVDVNDPASQ